MKNIVLVLSLGHDIDSILMSRETGGTMKAPLMTRATARRFSLIFVLLLAMAAWTFSISAARAQTQQGAGQTAKPPAASPGQTEQARSAPEAAKTLQENTAAQPPAEPLPAGSGQALREQADQTQTTSQPEAASTNCPPEYIPLIQKTTASLMASNFTFYPVKALDPFVPFLTLEPRPEDEEEHQRSSLLRLCKR